MSDSNSTTTVHTSDDSDYQVVRDSREEIGTIWDRLVAAKDYVKGMGNSSDVIEVQIALASVEKHVAIMKQILNDVDGCVRDLIRNRDEIGRMRKERNKAQKATKSVKRDLNTLQHQFETVTMERMALHNETMELQASHNAVLDRLQTEINSKERAIEKLQEIDTNLNNATNELINKDKQIDDLREEFNKLMNQVLEQSEKNEMEMKEGMSDQYNNIYKAQTLNNKNKMSDANKTSPKHPKAVNKQNSDNSDNNQANYSSKWSHKPEMNEYKEMDSVPSQLAQPGTWQYHKQQRQREYTEQTQLKQNQSKNNNKYGRNGRNGRKIMNNQNSRQLYGSNDQNYSNYGNYGENKYQRYNSTQNETKPPYIVYADYAYEFDSDESRPPTIDHYSKSPGTGDRTEDRRSVWSS